MRGGRPVEPIHMRVNGHDLSALASEPADGKAKATILALPGGGYNCLYWHHPGAASASLLELGAAAGYRVVALDRPGYRASRLPDRDGVLLNEQADTIVAILNRLAAQDAGEVFLIGHSLGGIIALMAAARCAVPSLAGIDVSGVPYRYSVDLAKAVEGRLVANDALAGLSATSLFYGPAGSFDRRIVARGDVAAEALPLIELRDSFEWPSRFSTTVRTIDRPVRSTLGEHDRTTAVSCEILSEIAAHFAASPAVEMHLERDAGHNISLHHVGRAYHLNALGFFDALLASALKADSKGNPGD